MNTLKSIPTWTWLLGIVVLIGVYILVGAIQDTNDQVLTNRANGKTTQTYTRTMVCISSVSPTQRTPEYVKACYNTAESETGVKVNRYGDGR